MQFEQNNEDNNLILKKALIIEGGVYATKNDTVFATSPLVTFFFANSF